MPVVTNTPSLTVQSTTNESQMPLVGLPVGKATIYNLDAGTTTFLLAAPKNARWVNVSSTSDFILAMSGDQIPSPLPAPGNASVGELAVEVNPGLRYIGLSARKMQLIGISAGYCSVVFYS